MKNGAIRVLQIIDHLDLGGAQVLLTNLCTWQGPSDVALKYEVLVLHGNGRYVDSLRDAGIEVRSLAASKYALPRIILQLAKRLRRHDYELIHLHLPASSLLGAWLSALFSSAPVIVTIHALKSHTPWPGFYLFALIAPFVDAFVTLWPASREDLRSLGIPMSKIYDIPIGIDLSRAAPERSLELRQALASQYEFGPDRPFLLSVARLSADRHIHLLIDAMKEVASTCPEALLLMIGDGEERVSLEERVRHLGLQDNVIFVGARTDVWNVFPACDLYLSMSGGCEIGVAALEAMACKRPVIAYNTALMAESRKRCEGCGVFITTRDASALARAILELLADPGQAEALGDEARESVNKAFSLDTMVRKYHRLYQHLVKTTDFRFGSVDLS